MSNEWTPNKPKITGVNFLCQSKKEQCHLVMMNHSRAAQSRWLPNKDALQKKLLPNLGICVETLKSWLKRAGFQPEGTTDRQNRIDKRQRELEAEIRSLRKQLAEKDEVIDVLKNPSAYFRNYRRQVSFHRC